MNPRAPYIANTMHLAPLIRDLAIILGVAGLISLLFHKIRQPVVLGYIISGMLIGPHTPPFQLVTDLPSIKTWAELGVIFLMFSLGLEFSFRKLTKIGTSAAITTGMEVMFFIPVGFLLGKVLGWTSMDSLFLGAMLSISSTTIIIKALDELKLKKHHFAELIFSVLVVEDLVAILLLVALGTIAVTKTVAPLDLLMATLKLVLVVGGWFVFGYFVVPRFIKVVGATGSNETLTILSLGLCLFLVVFATHFEYSTALGAFIMGSILAESPFLSRIEHNMTSLRDVFGAVFFVSIGMLIDPKILLDHWGAIGLICVVTIVGKVLSTTFGELVSGQSLKNSLQVGFGLAQIGEFSFIIAQLGLSLKVTSDYIYPIGVAVSLVTTFTTPYLIRHSSWFAEQIEKRLPVRILDGLNRYAAQAEAKRAGAGDRRSVLRPFLKWAVNGLTASIIFILCSEWVLPLLAEEAGLSENWVPLLGWCVGVVVSSPFIYGMLVAFRGDWGTNPEAGTTGGIYLLGLLSRGMTALWIGLLSAEFFPGRFVALGTIGFLVLAFYLFYQQLEKAYRWFESKFLSTFTTHPENPDETPEPSQVQAEDSSKEILTSTPGFKHLAPWDVHLTSLEVHPNSKTVMKKVSEAAFRVRFGVNIVAIRRGNRSIMPPKPDDSLLPHDELVLLGSDAQIDKLRSELEEAPSTSTPTPIHYELRQAKLKRGTSFIGSTIRASGIRETYHAMVVGLERKGERIVNPDSDLKLMTSDVLWVAGDQADLNTLIQALENKK